MEFRGGGEKGERERESEYVKERVEKEKNYLCETESKGEREIKQRKRDIYSPQTERGLSVFGFSGS